MFLFIFIYYECVYFTPAAPPPVLHSDHLDAPGQEEGDEDISGTQFVCETVIRSLTLEEPDHRPRRRLRQGSSMAKPASKIKTNTQCSGLQLF